MLRGAVARTLWTARGAARIFPEQIKGQIGPGHEIPTKFWPGRCLEGVRGVHFSQAVNKAEGRKEMLASMPRRDDGTEGEAARDIDSNIRG